ncbi:hypothetical protein Scep_022006 [Stephania cephalantha]|uniref:Protein kinase domain-containing protein n=1 Tax=Stephania cephalantha TaxID=152367 RepID=A0AAP0I0N0_9MAGN
MAHNTDLVIIGVSVGVAIGIILAACAFFAIRLYRKRPKSELRLNESNATSLPIRLNGIGTSADFSASLSSSISIPVNGSNVITKSAQPWWKHGNNKMVASTSGVPRYSYKYYNLCLHVVDYANNCHCSSEELDIQKATENFTTQVGEGSFGPVYKAKLHTGQEVAVKVLASNSRQGEKEFQTEVHLLGRLHHRNLVNLIGYCIDKGQHMLIYEYMSNGSLASLLYDEGRAVLSWDERLQVALDVTHGIEYLHEGAVPPIIHRDLKSANILLDKSMMAKVADFGLSREEAFDGRNSGLKGTYGYMDPDYISSNKFTKKSDIYSLGIILFELITAIHPQQNLIEYVNLAGMSSNGVDEILDNKLVGECNLEEVRLLAGVAHLCLHKTPRRRPSIGDVSLAISKIKQQHLRKENTMSFSIRNITDVVRRIDHQQVELSSMPTMKVRI